MEEALTGEPEAVSLGATAAIVARLATFAAIGIGGRSRRRSIATRLAQVHPQRGRAMIATARSLIALAASGTIDS